MDQRERIAGLEEAVRTAFDGFIRGVWTALPGIVVSFDPDKLTAVIQPAVQAIVAKQDGTAEAVNLPVLPDVPVVPQRGGGCTLTFPIKPGDECLVVFASRSIDGWYQSGGVQMPIDTRAHDLSDGFAILGPFSQSTKIANWNTDAVELRSDDGEATISLNPSSHDINVDTSGNLGATVGGTMTAEVTGDVNVTSSGTLKLEASTIILKGTVQIQGDTTATGKITASGDVTGQGTSLHGHKHGGVQTGGGQTGTPI